MRKILPSIYKSRYYSFLIDDYVKNDIPLISISTSTVPSFFVFNFEIFINMPRFFSADPEVLSWKLGKSRLQQNVNKMSTRKSRKLRV